MNTAAVHTHPSTKPRPGPGEHPGTTAKAGDLVVWTNPQTQEAWPGLDVEFAYPRQQQLLVRGHFGRFRQDGSEHEQSRPVMMADCVVTKRAGER